MDDISKKELAAIIDHTDLYPDATSREIQKLCKEAEKHGFGAVCVYSGNVEQANKLTSNNINICSVVGFPSGQESTAAKTREAAHAVEKGADEIDVVINQGHIKDGKLEEAAKDLKRVRNITSPDTIMKVIAENCNLTDEEKVMAYKAADMAGADFIKTSTGFGDHGARAEDLELMAETIKELDSDMGIKASGGIGSREKAEKMVKASGMPLDPDRFRIGASSSTEIIS